MSQKTQTSDAIKAQVLAGQATALTDYAAKALADTQQLRIKTKPMLPFPWTTLKGRRWPD